MVLHSSSYDSDADCKGQDHGEENKEAFAALGSPKGTELVANKLNLVDGGGNLLHHNWVFIHLV